jgi:hypothetical protein
MQRGVKLTPFIGFFWFQVRFRARAQSPVGAIIAGDFFVSPAMMVG